MRPLAVLLLVNLALTPYHAGMIFAWIMGAANSQSTADTVVGSLLVFVFASLPTLVTAVFLRKRNGTVLAVVVTELLLVLAYSGAIGYILLR